MTTQWKRALLAASALVFIVGIQLFVLTEQTDRFFASTINPPITAAFLGAAYWAAAVLFSWAARQRHRERIWIAALPEATVAVLLLIATQLHLDKFHDDLFGYFWVAVYAIAAPVLIYLIAGTHSAPGAEAGPVLPLPPWLRLVLALQATVFAIYGIGLFVSPSGFDGAWPWPLTPLTARAIAAFLLGFAMAAAIAVRGNSLRRLRGAALTYAVLGALELLAAVLHSSDFRDAAALPGFLAFFATVLAAGLAGALLNRAAQPSSSRSAFSGS